ncbi:hypothetical protein [Clavibacter zhangzhiyongii]|uniref:hypothetical protein n=1 Tax=Clavibacter zhangzhiyongii TaxID=2768071 RepID=UPI0039E00E10
MTDDALDAMGPQAEFWVPEAEADALTASITSQVAATAPEGLQVSVARSDWGTYDYDPLLAIKILVGEWPASCSSWAHWASSTSRS